MDTMSIKNTVIKKINMTIISTMNKKNTVIKKINMTIITGMLTANMIHIFGLIQ